MDHDKGTRWILPRRPQVVETMQYSSEPYDVCHVNTAAAQQTYTTTAVSLLRLYTLHLFKRRKHYAGNPLFFSPSAAKSRGVLDVTRGSCARTGQSAVECQTQHTHGGSSELRAQCARCRLVCTDPWSASPTMCIRTTAPMDNAKEQQSVEAHLVESLQQSAGSTQRCDYNTST